MYTVVYRKFEEGTSLHSLKMDGTYITGTSDFAFQIQICLSLEFPGQWTLHCFAMCRGCRHIGHEAADGQSAEGPTGSVHRVP